MQKVLFSLGLQLLQSQPGGKTAGPHTSGLGKPRDSRPGAQAQKPGDPRPIPALPVSHSGSGASLLAPLSGPTLVLLPPSRSSADLVPFACARCLRTKRSGTKNVREGRLVESFPGRTVFWGMECGEAFLSFLPAFLPFPLGNSCQMRVLCLYSQFLVEGQRHRVAPSGQLTSAESLGSLRPHC